MANSSKAQTAVDAIFGDREREDKKVVQMTILYPRVNSTEYHAFRKLHEKQTHHDVTALYIANHFADAEQPFTNENVVAWLQTNYIERVWEAGDIEIQVAQYLGQLTFRGWSGLINAARKIYDGRK